MYLQTKREFIGNVKRLRKQFEGTKESPRSIYILNVKREAFTNKKARNNLTFPSEKYPPLVENPRGFVYVGMTGLSVEERFAVHQSKKGKACKIAKLGFLSDGSYSRVGKKLTATYNGISVQDSWEEQVRYLQNEKIGKYHHHFFARYHLGKVVEVYRMTAHQVLNILVPNLKRQFESTSNRKDPRLGYTISNKLIKQHGVKVL